MDTLISLGTLAAFGWSLWALFFGTAGMPGMTHPFEFTIDPRGRVGQHLPGGRGRGDRVHPGRPLLRGALQAPRRRRAAGPAGARRQGRRGAARRREKRDPDRPARGRRPVRRPARREDRHRRRRSSEGSSAVDAVHADRRVRAGGGRPGRRASSGATVNAGGRLVVRATRVGADTQLAQMARLVEEAQTGKAQRAAAGRPDLRRSSCRSSSRWPSARSASGSAPAPAPAAAFTAAVAVLIIACPCALGLATPTALHGRHRPRRPARHPDQGPGGAGVHPHGRHRRPGQDRHRHHRAG